MNRPEAIKGIIWSLLVKADAPQQAVASAFRLKPHLGSRAEGDFRNLLRAAGLFARDDDGFFVRYDRQASHQRSNDGPSVPPAPTHLLTVPVPVEPRMRIAYSVFTGLLLKHLYQRYAVVPLEVTEGMAQLWVSNQPAAPAWSLAGGAVELWNEFQHSELAENALGDGIEATFSGLRGGRRIGALEIPLSWKCTRIERLLRTAVGKNSQSFQKQAKADKIQFTGKPQTSGSVPFAVFAMHASGAWAPNNAGKTGGTRCLVCGSEGEMIQGGKFFLPENKKQWYEEPGPRDKFPRLCATCAYLALLSGITPTSDQSILEYPTDNFLELFALHENLQGISGTVALKSLNRVSALSVFPSRYLLLSRNSRQGRMDSKTQIYMQLRKHAPLLRTLDKPIRVQVEGNQPNFWSQVFPHIAIGLSYFAGLPSYYETGARKIVAQRVTHALAEGRAFEALYLVTQAQQPDGGFGWERNVVNLGLRVFETEFVVNPSYSIELSRALGGAAMNPEVFGDVIEFSNFLLDIVRPLVQREVDSSRSAVSGVARKYTELITRDFMECRTAKFLYVVCQEVDAAERDGDGWAKRLSLEKLYGSRPTLEGKSGADAAKAWADFRENHPETVLEQKIRIFCGKYPRDAGLWPKFLGEVQARTLALLLLNVRNKPTR